MKRKIDKTAYEYTHKDWQNMWELYHSRKEKIEKLITIMYNERFISNKAKIDI